MPIISLVHTKGGVAKTTSAMYLAAAAVLRGLNVVLVDADPQGSALEWAADATADGPMPFPVVPASRRADGDVPAGRSAGLADVGDHRSPSDRRLVDERGFTHPSCR